MLRPCNSVNGWFARLGVANLHSDGVLTNIRLCIAVFVKYFL